METQGLILSTSKYESKQFPIHSLVDLAPWMCTLEEVETIVNEQPYVRVEYGINSGSFITDTYPLLQRNSHYMQSEHV